MTQTANQPVAGGAVPAGGVTLAGKVALVTGASSGVGRAVAVRLAGSGATVCLVGRDEARLAESLERARRDGGRAFDYRADLMNDAEIEGLRGRVREDTGGVDFLIHSAGAITLGPLRSGRVQELEAQLRTNLMAPYRLTQIFLSDLIERRGQVVFVNSTSGLRGSAGSAAYTASKHGLRGLADSLRDEVNVDGVRVLSVFLGRTATPMQERIHAEEGKPYRPERLIQAADVADAICFALQLPATVEVTELRLRPAQKP